MACLKESDLQGYLEESGPSPLRQLVEGHLVTCARCRATFDRVVATHRRVNAWLSELSSPADGVAIDVPGALARILSRVETPGAINGGAIIDHEAPRERRFVAVEK